MPDSIPKYLPGQSITMTAGQTITGGRALIVNSVGNVILATDNANNVIGIAAHDAVNGQPLTVWTRGGVYRCTSSAAVARGSAVKAAALGKVQTSTATAAAAGTMPDFAFGIALTAATAADQTIEIATF